MTSANGHPHSANGTAIDADTILTGISADETLTAWHDKPGQGPRPVTGDAGEPGRLPVPPPAADPAMFHGVLGDLVRAADPTTEADPVGVLTSLMAGAGVAIGTAPHIQIGNSRHPLLIWPLLFGRTGAGRKGEATDTAELFLHAAVNDYDDISASGLSTGEGLIERIRDPANEEDDGGTLDKRLCVCESEFSATLARAKREGSTLGTVLRQAWDGKTLAVLNRTAYKASRPHVAIIGHIPPKEFRLRMADSDMAGGSYNRFLPVYVERSKEIPLPEGLPADVLADMAARLRAAIAAARDITRIHLDSGAVRLWSSGLYSELSAADDDDHAWTEFTRRSAPYCLRIAALHAALDGVQLVTTDHLTAAAALVRYSIASAMYVLDRQMRNPRLDKLRRAIDGAGSDGVARSGISALFSRNAKKPEIDELLQALLDSGEYEQIEVKTGGRAATCYRRTQPAAA